MYSIYYCDKFAFNLNNIDLIKTELQERLNLSESDYYILQNGKRIRDSFSKKFPLHVVPKLIGGKGGFGSMLRAIGAQIEKTTNREACRDLSGRRLRDINEEKRLKTWIEQQVEREKEAKDRKQKKLERLVHIPKHVFKDDSYEKDRSDLPEKVEDALEQGLKASSSMGNKRTHEDDVKKQKKRPKLWMADEELSCSSDDSCNEETSESEKAEQKKEDSCSSNSEQKEVFEEASNSSKENEKIDEKEEENTDIPCKSQVEIINK